MKEFKGTPGPWVASHHYSDVVTVIDSQGLEVVTAEHCPIMQNYEERLGINHWADDERAFRYLSEEEQSANAHLIAAAPYLLNELQRLRDYVINICGVDDGDCDSEHPLMSSKAAIIKALGDE